MENKKSYLNENVEKWLKNINSLMIKQIDDYSKVRKSFTSKRRINLDNDLGDKKMHKILKMIEDDDDYQKYRSLTEKKNKVNKLNFFSKQVNINIIPTKPLKTNLLEKSEFRSKKLFPCKIDEKLFIKYKNMVKKTHKEIIEFEQDFSSSDSYDSDFLDIDETNLEKKINKIKKNELSNKDYDIKNDIRNIIIMLDKIKCQNEQ